MSLAASRTLTLAGRSYTLRLGVDGIVALERELGVPFHQFDERLAKAGLGELRALLWANLLEHHKLSLTEVTALIEEAGIPAVLEALKVEAPAAPRPTKATKAQPRAPSRGTGAASSSRGSKRA